MCDTDLGRRARELLLLVYPYVRRTAYNGWIMERLEAAVGSGEARTARADGALLAAEGRSPSSEDAQG